MDEPNTRRLSERAPIISWLPTHETGGPLDRVLAAVRAAAPEVVIHRLLVTHPGDDDNVWWLVLPDGREAQLDSSPHGRPPFHLDLDTGELHTVLEPDEAVRLLTAWLRG